MGQIDEILIDVWQRVYSRVHVYLRKNILSRATARILLLHTRNIYESDIKNKLKEITIYNTIKK